MNSPETISIPTGDFLLMKAQIAAIYHKLELPAANKSILSRACACIYVGKKSMSAFDRWVSWFAPKSQLGCGRYDTAELDAGILKERRR